ncbi:stalk domain-containing protein [Sporosarcina sp. SAFN-015]|uniref:stalk domain-containing protein n=1 Tax=Sporosarcina sp. SAFN-015 TaxID=3387274 RepID=UPI003F7D9C47
MLLLSFLVPTIIASAETVTPTFDLWVNNKQAESMPFYSAGTLYVPFGEIANKMGEEVTVLPSRRKHVSFFRSGFSSSVTDGYTIGIVNGSIVPLRTIEVNGQTKNAEVKAVYKDEEVYVPLEFIEAGEGLTYPVEVIKEGNLTTIYVGELPKSVKDLSRKRTLEVKVNNKLLSGKLSPFVSDSTTYVPILEIAKLMGSEPYAIKNQVMVPLSGMKRATVTVGKSIASIYDPHENRQSNTWTVPLKEIMVHANPVIVNAKAIQKNGHVFVPLEFISSTSGLNYEVKTVKDQRKTTIYIGALPNSLQEPINQVGYATQRVGMVSAPGKIYSMNAVVKNQQIHIDGAQGNWYKIKMGKHVGYVKKDHIQLGKTAAKGKMFADGWVAPTLKSKWSKDPEVNRRTLENELGFTHDGAVFDVYGMVRAIEVIQNSSKSQEVGIQFYGWQSPDAEQSYRIPIVSKELFKLYFGKDADRVWNYFNRNDIPDKFTANGRTVKAQFIKATGSIYLEVGHKK